MKYIGCMQKYNLDVFHPQQVFKWDSEHPSLIDFEDIAKYYSVFEYRFVMYQEPQTALNGWELSQAVVDIKIANMHILESGSKKEQHTLNILED